MNPVQIVEAARPEVGTMPAIDRRHLRERIFDVAMRSQTNHAPVPVAKPNTRRANTLRLAALGMLGAIAIGGLVYSASRGTPGDGATAIPSADATDGSDATRITIGQAPDLSVAPSTTVPPIAGSGETPLLLPPERNRLDALTVTRAPLGASAVLLRAPDLSTISLFEVDGLAPAVPAEPEPAAESDEATTSTTTTTIPLLQFAAVSVEQPAEDSPGQYQLQVPCGTVTVLDDADQPAFRPEMTELFNAMRIVDGVIDVSLPEGWGVISAGPSTDRFLFGLPVDLDGRSVTLTLAQYPEGSIALAAGDDQLQYGPTTFNGQPAWLHNNPDDPNAFDLVTMVGTTAININTSGMSLSEAESVIAGLTPGDVDEWTNRFGTLPVDVDPDVRTCADQPAFRFS